MTNKELKDIKNYIKEAKLYLPTFHKEEKRFIADLKASLMDYAITNKECDMNSLINEFGEPREVSLNFICSQDGEALRKALIKSKYIRRSIYIVIILLFAILQVKTVFYYIDLKKAEESYINKEVIIIEED